MNPKFLIVAAVGGYGLWWYSQRAARPEITGPVTTNPNQTTTPGLIAATPKTRVIGRGSGGVADHTTSGGAAGGDFAANATNPDFPGHPPPAADRAEGVARRAANGDAASIVYADSMGLKFNSDQWNWYRWAGSGVQTTTDLFPAGDRGALMTASEYLARRAAAGLSGLDDGGIDPGVMVFAAVAIVAALALATSKG